MSKLINGFFMITSFIVIVLLVITMVTLGGEFGGMFGYVDFEDIIDVLSYSSYDEVLYLLTMFGVSIFMLFGFPVTIFLISYNNYRK